MRKIRIISNPSSGKENSLDLIKELLDYLVRDNWNVELCFTKEAGDATRFAKDYNGEDVLACIGGDGTVNEVVNGLFHAEKSAPLAILPTGTVNDFATYIGMNTNVEDFYNVIKNGRIENVDLGTCNDKAFINVAAGGMFAEIAHDVPKEQKAVLGRMAYYLEGVREFIKNFDSIDGFELTVKTPKKEFSTKAILFVIANSRSVGGFRNLIPEAEIHDGLLDVMIFKELKMSDILEIIARFRQGKHIDNSKIIYFQCERIELSSDRKIALDIDGENAGFLPAVVEVEESAVKILVK